MLGRRQGGRIRRTSFPRTGFGRLPGIGGVVRETVRGRFLVILCHLRGAATAPWVALVALSAAFISRS